MALHDVPRERADAPRAERIGGDATDLDVDRRAGGQRRMQRRRAFGLQRDDARAPGEPRRDAADQPAAAHADQQRIGHAGLLLDLARQRAGAGQHLRLVVGVGHQRAALALALLAGGEGVGIGRAGDDDGRAELLRAARAWPAR